MIIREIRERLALLSRGERVRWASMAPLGAATAALEAAGGALVFTLLAVVVDRAGDSAVADYVHTVLPDPTGRKPIIALAALAAAVHILKNVVVVVFSWWRARVVAFDSAALSTRLLRAYMGAPWPFHLRRGSAILMENLRESARPFLEIFDSAATIATETAVIVALSAIAVAAAPLTVTATSAVLALLMTMAIRATRAAQRRGGARQFELGAALYRHVQHSLGALKEVRILGRAPFFVDAFSRDAAAAARLDARRATLDALPRLLLETTFAAGLLALIAWGATRRADDGSVLPLVTLYAYVGFRIIPAANRIALQVNSVRWSLAATESLVADLRQLERSGPERVDLPRLEFRDRIVARAVSFTYEGARSQVLRDVSLTIRRGESIAIAGETGAGKTTLADVLLGFLAPTSGTVLTDGSPMLERVEGWHRNIGYVPQSPFLLDDTIRRNVALGLPDAEVDEQALARAIRAAGLDVLVRDLPDGLETAVGERGIRLSGGERQRIAIARALYRDPALIVFDEATSSLDPATEREVAAAIDALRGDRTVIVIAHRVTTMARCERVVMLSAGRIVADGPFAELATANAAFRALAALT